ncbi:PKD domain protein [uncultured archaeon]|nr:PKD domain protein [uncultured archaeon]
MINRIGALVVSIFFITNMCTCFNNSIQAKETSITWSCTLHVNESGGKQDEVVFGEAPDAGDGPPPDSYDVVKPPTPIAPYVKAFFTDNLPSPYDSIWKDYRQYPSASKIWNLTIQWMPGSGSSPTTITVSWLTSEIDNSEYTSVNLCTDTGTILKNMLIYTTYTFSCPAYVPQNFKIRCENTNNPPVTPNIPSGNTTGYHGTSYTYSTSSTDPNGNDLSYQFDWGDTTISSWLGPYQSGELIQTSYIWDAPGTYQVTVKARDIYGTESNWSPALSVEMVNRAPNQPTNPSPAQGATEIPITPTLRWIGSDPDNIDIVTYDIYFGTTSSPLKRVSRQSDASFHPGTLQNQTTYYWQIITWDDFGSSTSSPLWSFSTKDSENDSSNQTNNETNQPPIANASLSQQTGVVGTLLILNGSRSNDPDGYLTKWLWDFGDHTNGSGERTTHTYQNAGSYTVTLTVVDEKNATGNDTILVQILPLNRPPTKPVINGTRTGTKHKMLTYTVQSTDLENNFLQYTITWGDGTQNTSAFLPNRTIYSLSHSWNSPGKYMITATATDNITWSEHASFPVFIDAHFVDTLGFLLDSNNDGVYDSFYTNVTSIATNVQKLTNGSYLLDTDTDGKWNYLYNPSLSSLTKMDTIETTIENQWIFVFIIVLAIAVIMCIVYFYKKNYF